MSYKPGFNFKTEGPVFNEQRFATYEEAQKSAEARFQRWTTPTGYGVFQSDDPVNYRWDDEAGDVPIGGNPKIDWAGGTIEVEE
jgi:hypothetical protein